MAPPSLDCAPSTLFCAEDNNSIMDFDEKDEKVVYNENDLYNNVGNYQSDRFFGDTFDGFSPMSDECCELMVAKECEHLPIEDYVGRLMSGEIDLSGRSDAIDWIQKVHAYYNFGPLSAYVSINYLDRFLSVYELPKGKAWMMQLLSVACLSLAAKMEETEVPLSLDLQVCGSKFLFEAKTIQRMELLVLSTLKWRMQVITPFSFIDYFLRCINDYNSPKKSLISRAVELTLGTIKGIEFLGFRPSEVAAAIAFSVQQERQLINMDHIFSSFLHIDKKRVITCCEKMEEMGLTRRYVKDDNGSGSSIPQSPIGVLDAACMSFKSEDKTVESCGNSYNNSPATKKRKLNRLSEMSLNS